MYNNCIIIKVTQTHTDALTQSTFSVLYYTNQNSALTLLSTTLTEIPSLRRRFLARVWTPRSLSSMSSSVIFHVGHPCRSSNNRTTWLCVRGFSSALLFNAMLLKKPMRVVEKKVIVNFCCCVCVIISKLKHFSSPRVKMFSQDFANTPDTESLF